MLKNSSPQNLRLASNKVVLIGDSNVGKTCLISRFYNDTYTRSPPIIGATQYSKNNYNLKIDVWGTA